MSVKNDGIVRCCHMLPFSLIQEQEERLECVFSVQREPNQTEKKDNNSV